MAFEGEGGTGGEAGGGEGAGGGLGGSGDLLGGGGGDAGGAAAGGGASGGDGAAGTGGDAGSAGAAGGDAGAGGADPDFYAHLSTEAGEGDSASLRDWVKSSGIKDINGLAKVARDNQAALRADGRIRVPGEGATPEDVAAYHKAIGVPEEAGGYTVEAPKDATGNAIPLDNDLIAAVTAAGVKYGVPKAAMEGVLADVIKRDLDANAAHTAQLDAEAQAWVKEQGANASAKIAAVDSAASALGLTREEMTRMRVALGPARALGILSKLGEGMSEDVMITGGRGRFGVSGAEAQAELDKLKLDPAFAKKAGVPGTPEHQRWNRLIDAVAADEERKRQSA